MYFLNDRPIASGTGSLCASPIQRLADVQQLVLLDKIFDVSALTAQQSVTLRVLATVSPTVFPPEQFSWWKVYGSMWMLSNAVDNNLFGISSVRDLPGTKPVKGLQIGMRKNDKKVYKLIGVPDGSRATFNTFGLRIAYQPASAAIVRVRPYVEYPSGASEDLAFSYVGTPANGSIVLSDVGFANPGGNRPLWTTKGDNAYVTVEVEARLPGQTTTVTKTARLGLDPVTGRAGWTLTPLYDAGIIPGALRYGPSDHEESIGRDGWGTRDAFDFLSNHLTLYFNDLSKEHGGRFPPHTAHQAGTSIDILYLGPNGDANPLNKDPVARLNRWQQAKSGDVDALREMVDWIRKNREGMDQLFAAGNMQSILIGDAEWHFNPIMYGTFRDRTIDIIDPDTNQPIGAWQPAGRIKGAEDHLDHAHLERKPVSEGNQP